MLGFALANVLGSFFRSAVFIGTLGAASRTFAARAVAL